MPSRMGSMTLRSMMATDSSSFSVSQRWSRCSCVRGAACCCASRAGAKESTTTRIRAKGFFMESLPPAEVDGSSSLQGSCTAGEISQLNFRLGMAFADAARAGCKEFRVARSRVRLIGSHGQTIFHQGRPVSFLGRATASTLQIGEPSVIAARMGIPTVGDFRVADMAVGGQGAPLVPYVDALLLRDERIGRVALNLGGIGNVTVLLPQSGLNHVLAFDTGPGNMVIDALIAHFTKGRKRFDRDAK